MPPDTLREGRLSGEGYFQSGPPELNGAQGTALK